MIILAVYYTLADLILLGQIFLYGDGSQVDAVHLSPANPLTENIFDEIRHDVLGESDSAYTSLSSDVEAQRKSASSNRSLLVQCGLICLVILSGLLGWYFTYNPDDSPSEPDLTFDPTAQFFGWLSAALYLGSRMPQILLNYKRKSCEGISFLFFLCACLGNLTYVISILSVSVDPYFLLVQSSWLAGSIGTLSMDFVIFIQFFVYNTDEDDGSVDEISD
jgi:uncharacterized protein with PQ loop repeat